MRGRWELSLSHKTFETESRRKYSVPKTNMTGRACPKNDAANRNILTPVMHRISMHRQTMYNLAEE
jgi:hypothetical protein